MSGKAESGWAPLCPLRPLHIVSHFTNMSQMKNYLLRILELCSDQQFGQDAVEWAIVSGHVPLTYDLEADLIRIMGPPGFPELGEYDDICAAYRRYCNQHEAVDRQFLAA